jgi:hypothetical protein
MARLVPTFSINPSRIKTVPASSTSPGLTTTLPPVRAWIAERDGAIARGQNIRRRQMGRRQEQRGAEGMWDAVHRRGGVWGRRGGKTSRENCHCQGRAHAICIGSFLSAKQIPQDLGVLD